MPTLPATDGLPVWAQVLISLLVCIATLAVAFKGYFAKSPPTPVVKTEETAQLSLAALMEHGAIRHNSDTNLQLTAAVIALTTCINELTHHERNNVEAKRELCEDLRRVAEALDRFHN